MLEKKENMKRKIDEFKKSSEQDLSGFDSRKKCLTDLIFTKVYSMDRF